MTIVSPMGQLRPVFADKNGKRLSGGKVFTYEPGTLTPKATYTDALNLIPNTNPIDLNKYGEADIFLNGDYRIRVVDRHGVLIDDYDNLMAWATKKYLDLALSGFASGASKFYPTLAGANADIANIAVSQIVNIGELENGGLWFKESNESTTLTKAPYDTLELAKQYSNQKQVVQEQYINDLFAAQTQNVENLINQQGVSLQQLDDYYNYLMQRLAQIAIDKGWEASFVVSAGGDNQQEINDRGGSYWREKPLGYDIDSRVMLENGDIVRSTFDGNTNNPNTNMAGWVRTNDASQIFDASGLPQQRLNNITVIPQMFGPVGTSDDYETFFKCINSFPEEAALNIFIPAGNYNVKKPLYITRPHNIYGVGGLEGIKSNLNFSGGEAGGLPSCKGAIWIYHPNTAPLISLPEGQVGTYGGGAIIEKVGVFNSPECGIVLNAPATINDIRSSNNAKDGLAIHAGNISLEVAGGNANHSIITHSRFSSNGKSGIRMEGYDSNSFLIQGCAVTTNAEYGINDQSWYGGAVIGCEADGNGIAHYNTRSGPHDNSGKPITYARTAWVGNYAEPNQVPNYSMSYNSTVFGATGGQPTQSAYLTGCATGIYAQKNITVATSEANAVGESGAFGKLGAGLIKLGFSGVSDKFEIAHNSGYVGIKVSGVASNAIAIRTDSSFNNTIKHGRVWFPQGFALSQSHAQTAASAAPTTGTYDKGNIVWNDNPVAGGKIGWVCITEGSPGVWKAFGSIDP